MLEKLKFRTEKNSVICLTNEIDELLTKNNILDGVCVIFIPHTTAAITINSRWDTLTLEDIMGEIHRLIPTRVDFLHQHDTPEDAAGHVKSTLVGCSITVIIAEGKLLLGESQGVFFLEFDGPRDRYCYIRIINCGG